MAEVKRWGATCGRLVAILLLGLLPAVALASDEPSEVPQSPGAEGRGAALLDDSVEADGGGAEVEAQRQETAARRLARFARGEALRAVALDELLGFDMSDAHALKVHRSKAIKAANELEEGDEQGLGGAAPVESVPPSVRLAYWTHQRRLAELRILRISDRRLAKLVSAQRAAHDAYLAEQGLLAQHDRQGAEAKQQETDAQASSEARTEASRLIDDEVARLLRVAAVHQKLGSDLAAQRQLQMRREERLLLLKRKSREALDGQADAESVLLLYREIERGLGRAQKVLADGLVEKMVVVEGPGVDPTEGLTSGVDLERVLKLRKQVETEKHDLNLAFGEEYSARLELSYRAMRELNTARLELVEYLPDAERDSILGMTLPGLRIAGLELRQVGLILRYHLAQSLSFIREIESDRRIESGLAMRVTIVSFELALLWLLFVGLRRRLSSLVSELRRKNRINARRLGIQAARRNVRMITVLERTYPAASWLGLLWFVNLVLPAPVQSQLEVRLLFSVLMWVVAAGLFVQAIDGWASGRSASGVKDSSVVRLRSLRLIAQTTVTVGLVLSVSAQLVGRGTIFSWVSTFAWFWAIPASVLLAIWWRPIVVSRLQRRRRERGIEHWVLSHSDGRFGFISAGIGGLYLLFRGTSRWIRERLDASVLTRRVLAYLFQRELDRRAAEAKEMDLSPLSNETWTALSPEWVPDVIDSPIPSDEVLKAELAAGPGRIVALIGERGAGKSTLLALQTAERKDVVWVRGAEDTRVLANRFAEAVDVPRDGTLRVIAQAAEENANVGVVVIDGAHKLVQPRIGGIAPFDELLSAVREHTTGLSWFMIFEEVSWNFYEGARGAKPTFDAVIQTQPWNEDEIRHLIEARTKAAGIDMDFALLMPKLPRGADRWDRLDALESAKKSFYRLLWDYAAGNPAVALHLWRKSLAVAPDGTAFVKIFQGPRAAELEDLPDSATFVLRAAFVLGRASTEKIRVLSRLPEHTVLDTLRYFVAREYIEKKDSEYRITWAWYRAISVYLERKHFIAPRRGWRSA